LRQSEIANGHDVTATPPNPAQSPGHDGQSGPKRRLLVSIHDVSPHSQSAVDALADRLQGHLGGANFAMLVIPDHWRRAPIAGNAAFHARLRAWADQGIEMFLHGWCHRDETPATGRLAQIKGQHMTAGEGEFLSLTQIEAARRMREGKALLEDILGAPVAGFIAPAWLYGPGALAALNEIGFALAEDHMKVWAPGHTGTARRVLSRGPVVTWASRSPGRIRSSLGFAALARHALPILPTLRVAVHPGDVTVPALLDSIDATVTRFAQTHRPSRYASLLP
jgi:predicted deacetylase